MKSKFVKCLLIILYERQCSVYKIENKIYSHKQKNYAAKTEPYWIVLTFEGSPDRKVSQGKGMSNQEGAQGKSLIQFTQCCSQRLTTQTASTELQPVVNLQIPDAASQIGKKNPKLLQK